MKKASSAGFFSLRHGVFCFMAILYRVCLDWLYANIVSTSYSYMNFQNNFSVSFYVVSWMVYALFTVIVIPCYNNYRAISKEILFLLYLFYVSPFTTMLGFGQFTASFALSNVIYLFLLLALARPLYSLKRKKIHLTTVRGIVSNQLLVLILVMCFVVVVYISGRYVDFRMNLSIDSNIIYSMRAESREINLPFYLRYPFSWTRVIMPVLIAYFLTQKKYALVALGLVTQLLSFGYDGMKAPFFMTILAIVFNVWNVRIQKINLFVFAGQICFCLLCILEKVALGSYYLTGVFSRRLWFLPNLISSFYFDFFTKNIPDYFRSSILSGLYNGGPYPEIPYTIGKIYFGSRMYCNNGLISDAITNLGKVGIIIAPCLVTIILKMLDECAEGIDSRIYITVSLSLAMTFINTFLSVALVTHGLIVLMVILLIIKRKDRRAVKRRKKLLIRALQKEIRLDKASENSF